MSKSKYKKYSPKLFESRGTGKYIDHNGTERDDTFTRIYQSMLYSNAFMKLTDRQKVLYLIAKSQFYGARKPKADKEYQEMGLFQGEEYFYLNWAAIKPMGIYKPTMASNFYKDMRALINYGFIERVASGKQQHKKTIYKFSDKWHDCK